VPVAALISTDPTNGPHTAGVPFKFDASPKIGAFSSTIIHYFTALNSLTSRDGARFQTNRICSVEAQAVCSARGDANSHGNDEWENDHEVRVVKSQHTSPPVELHRKFPVAKTSHLVFTLRRTKNPLCTSELTQIRTPPPASLSSLQAGMMGDDFCIDKMLGSHTWQSTDRIPSIAWRWN
jgi:hypothetical protein